VGRLVAREPWGIVTGSLPCNSSWHKRLISACTRTAWHHAPMQRNLANSRGRASMPTVASSLYLAVSGMFERRTWPVGLPARSVARAWADQAEAA
jgi:hypothetical protein